jgi:hypothetical protein
VKATSGTAFLAENPPPQQPLIYGLLARRDLVTLTARRRHGKTTLLTNLALALADPDAAGKKFIGFDIAGPATSLVVLLEDDRASYHRKFKRMSAGRDAARVHLLFRSDFQKAKIPIDVANQRFRDAIVDNLQALKPDLLVIDNLSHLIGAQYNDPKRIQEVLDFYYELVPHGPAIVTAAHPRKEGENPISLVGNPDGFFEATMGSSHFINNTGFCGVSRSTLTTASSPAGASGTRGRRATFGSSSPTMTGSSATSRIRRRT